MEINDVIRYDDWVVRGIVLEKRKKGGGEGWHISVCVVLVTDIMRRDEMGVDEVCSKL